MNKTLILVVEDDPPVRNLITTTLKTHEYKYRTAENGESAIMEASSHNPDIVLLDLGLLGVNLRGEVSHLGLGLAQLVRDGRVLLADLVKL